MLKVASQRRAVTGSLKSLPWTQEFTWVCNVGFRNSCLQRWPCRSVRYPQPGSGNKQAARFQGAPSKHQEPPESSSHSRSTPRREHKQRGLCLCACYPCKPLLTKGTLQRNQNSNTHGERKEQGAAPPTALAAAQGKGSTEAEPPSKAPKVELSFPYTFLNKPISL